jgi:EmrB/QacA subfamily drug resistance transporter
MMAVMIPASGWLSDRFGTQRIFVIAICVFVAGSLFCAASENLAFLVCSRAVQGVGGSMMLPVGRLAVLRNFPGEKFLPALSFVTIPGLIGPLLGPTLGGWLSEAFSWRWIFLINAPIGVIGAAATLVYMPNSRLSDPDSFDAVGYSLLAGAMISLSLAFGGLDMNLPLAAAAILALAGSAALYSYVRHAKKSGNPIFNLDVFRIRSFAIGLSGNLFARIGNGSIPYLLPLLMQTIMGYSPMRAGIMLLPSSIAGILAKRPATFLIRRYGYRRVLTANTALVGAAMASLSLISKNGSELALSALLFFFGAVNSIQFSAMNTLTLKDLPERDAGSGNSMLSMIQMLALSVAVVVASIVLGILETSFGQHDLSAAFHGTFIFMGLITALSTTIFMRL